MNIELAEEIKLRLVEEHAVVWSYYYPEFVKQAKSLQGEWNSKSESWQFNDKLFGHLSQLINGIYHVNGLKPYTVCRLRVMEFSAKSYQDACMLFDRPIAKAYDCDSGAKPQKDIYKLSGVFRSGGSQKN